MTFLYANTIYVCLSVYLLNAEIDEKAVQISIIYSLNVHIKGPYLSALNLKSFNV